MEKQEFKSKWDELAREIGAEIPQETEQRERAVSTISESATPEPKRRDPVEQAARTALPKKQPADWNLLAGELGLPPVPYDEPVVEERPPQAEQRPTFRESLSPSPSPKVDRDEPAEQQEPSKPRREESRERPDRGERGGRGRQRRDSQGQDRERSLQRRDSGRGRREETGPGREEGRRPREERGRGREQSGRGRDEPRRRREPRGSDVRPAMDVSEEIQEVTEIDSLHVELPVSPPSPPEPPTKSPAVSLWHKIFGSPAEQTAKMPEPAANEPAWNDDARGEAPRPAFDETFASPADEELAAGEFDDMSSRGERKSFADDDASDEERKRGRSRRRRRGGRGRKSGELQGERSPVPLQQESEGIDDLGVELDDADDDDDADQSASFADGAERPGSDLDIDDADGDSGELGGRGRSAAQRAIPSWDEAIGSIVDSNMQSRSQRRPPPRSGNGPRGRSRGRRRN